LASSRLTAGSYSQLDVDEGRITFCAFPGIQSARYARGMGSAIAVYQPRATEGGVLHAVIREHLETFVAEAGA